MEFLEKLIADTQAGKWDFNWKYSGEGSDTYSFNRPKNYLSGLNFSISKDKKAIVFPNGFIVTDEEATLKRLRDAINISLERTVVTIIGSYMSGDASMPKEKDGEEDTQPKKEDTQPKEKEIVKTKKLVPVKAKK
jgi:hypothetical protein